MNPSDPYLVRFLIEADHERRLREADEERLASSISGNTHRHLRWPHLRSGRSLSRPGARSGRASTPNDAAAQMWTTTALSRRLAAVRDPFSAEAQAPNAQILEPDQNGGR